MLNETAVECAISNERGEIISYMLRNEDDEDSSRSQKIEEEEEDTSKDELTVLKEKISRIEEKSRNLKEENRQKSDEIQKLKSILFALKGKENLFKLADYKEESIINENDTSIDKLITSIKKENFVIKEMKNFDQNQIQQFVNKYNFFFNFHHPFLVRLQGVNFGDDKQAPSLIYSYELNEKQKNQIAVEIVLGMRFIHSRNLIHLNLKPSNILLTKDNHVRINSFYLSKEDDSFQPPQSKYADSMKFLAPELCENKDQITYTNKVDIYAFGIVLIYLITNKYPTKDPKSLCINYFTSCIGLGSKWVRYLVRRCLYLYPEKRATFDEVLEIMKENNFDLFKEEDTEIQENEQNNLKQEIEKQIMMAESFEYLHQND